MNSTILRFSVLLLLGISTLRCFPSSKPDPPPPTEPATLSFKDSLILAFQQNPGHHSQGFDYPVGKGEAQGYYNAQPFRKNNHLGEDWNAVSGGNSDLGDPITSISNGYAISARNEGPGWGNVIRIIHYSPLLEEEFVESIYAHCDSMMVTKGTWVMKGEQIGTIGTADGLYSAHLHLEIRDSIGLPIGGGYSNDRSGFIHPTKFIQKNRSLVMQDSSISPE